MRLEARPDLNRQRIAVVEDFPVVRTGLQHLIQSQPDLTHCGDAETAAEARRLVRETRPALLILEPGLTAGDGMELIATLRRQHPELRILAYSRLPEAAFAERVIRAGAQGFVEKRESLDALLEAIRLLLQGGVRLRAEVMALATRPREGGGVAALSDRELEVFRLLGEGRSSREIANALGISIKTVGSHRSNAMKKLGARTAAQLLHQAVEWSAGLRRGSGRP